MNGSGPRYPGLEAWSPPEGVQAPPVTAEPVSAEGRGAALLTARLGLAKAELLTRAVAAQVRQVSAIYGMAGRDLEALAAGMILESLEQSARDLLTLQNRTGRVREGE